MAAFKYSKSITKGHPVVSTYNSVLIDADVLFTKEGCNVIPTPFYDRQVEIIDGDELERLVSSAIGRQLNKSVDVIFAIQDMAKTSQYLQFVELKFNSKRDFFYLDKLSFQEKVNGSKLAMGNSYRFNSAIYIVFKSNVIQQARRFLFRQNPKLSFNFQAIDVASLFNVFFN